MPVGMPYQRPIVEKWLFLFLPTTLFETVNNGRTFGGLPVSSRANSRG